MWVLAKDFIWTWAEVEFLGGRIDIECFYYLLCYTFWVSFPLVDGLLYTAFSSLLLS